MFQKNSLLGIYEYTPNVRTQDTTNSFVETCHIPNRKGTDTICNSPGFVPKWLPRVIIRFTEPTYKQEPRLHYQCGIWIITNLQIKALMPTSGWGTITTHPRGSDPGSPMIPFCDLLFQPSKIISSSGLKRKIFYWARLGRGKSLNQCQPWEDNKSSTSCLQSSC